MLESPSLAALMIHKQLDQKRLNHGTEFAVEECILVHDVVGTVVTVRFEANTGQLI